MAFAPYGKQPANEGTFSAGYTGYICGLGCFLVCRTGGSGEIQSAPYTISERAAGGVALQFGRNRLPITRRQARLQPFLRNNSGLIRLTQFWRAPVSYYTYNGKYAPRQQERPHLAQRRPQQPTQ